MGFNSGKDNLTDLEVDSGTISVDASNDRVGIGTESPSAKLEVEQASGGGDIAFKIDNDDTDKVAMSIEAANIDADVIDITADAVTSANVIDITADGLTSGDVINIVSDSSDTTARALIKLTNDNTAATGASMIELDQDSTGDLITANYGANGSAVALKVKACLDNNLTPIACVGETLDERESNNMQVVIEKQLQPILEKLTNEELSKIIIAYEPIWAIGTGLTATAKQAEKVHQFIREQMKDHEKEIKIIYGGSAKPENANSLLQEENIDGLLVGGASLDPKNFLSIVNNI